MTTTREQQRSWIAQRRADYMADKSCAGCGSTRDLEVDHIDPSQKVTHRVWSWSYPRRMAELAKCQILCSDCHLDKTLAERPRPEHGNPSRYRTGCRCDECKTGQREKMRLYRASRAA